MAELLTPESLLALVTLTAMEVVLGIDNLVFLTILAGKVPPEQRPKVRYIGLGLAVVMRIGLLFAISWVMGLTRPLWEFHVPVLMEEGQKHAIAGKSIILILGGLFLIGKATWEIHHQSEGAGHDAATGGTTAGAVVHASVGLVIVQVMLLDLVFSLDSVITAVGMVKHIPIMVVAVLISVGAMMLFAAPLGRFVEKHPSIKMLALAFLVLIGVMLTAEGLLPKERHIPKGYIYFAMVFSLGVELLNIRATTKRRKAQLAAASAAAT